MRVVSILCLLVVIGLAVAASVYYARTRWSSQGTYLQDAGYEGVIMDSDRFRSTARPDAWALTPDQIRTMEADLQVHVAATGNEALRGIAPELSRYYRHYYTWHMHNARTITTEFYHPTLITRYEWLHRTPVTADRSGLFWRIDYQLDSRTFTNFSLGTTP